MTRLLSLTVVCKDCKKPCDILGMTGLKKVHKKCCNEIVNLCSGKKVEVNIINGVIHL